MAVNKYAPWVPTISADWSDEILFDVHAQEARLYPLRHSAYLAVKGDEIKIEFAVFRFFSSETDGRNPRHTIMMRGTGFAGALRECRHTYWGETENGGYIFYPDFVVIEDALKELRRWFDG